MVINCICCQYSPVWKNKSLHFCDVWPQVAWQRIVDMTNKLCACHVCSPSVCLFSPAFFAAVILDFPAAHSYFAFPPHYPFFNLTNCFLCPTCWTCMCLYSHTVLIVLRLRASSLKMKAAMRQKGKTKDYRLNKCSLNWKCCQTILLGWFTCKLAYSQTHVLLIFVKYQIASIWIFGLLIKVQVDFLLLSS